MKFNMKNTADNQNEEKLKESFVLYIRTKCIISKHRNQK